METINNVIPDVDKDDIEPVELDDGAIKKFPAVKKAFKIAKGDKIDYTFIVTPIGYWGEINTVVVIDGKQDKVDNVKIVEHEETLIYAENITQDWFLDRFRNKDVKEYLERAILEANKPNEIIQVTAATISTQAVINGVNSAMGAYRELVLNETAESVPLKVEEFVTGVE